MNRHVTPACPVHCDSTVTNGTRNLRDARTWCNVVGMGHREPEGRQHVRSQQARGGEARGGMRQGRVHTGQGHHTVHCRWRRAKHRHSHNTHTHAHTHTHINTHAHAHASRAAEVYQKAQSLQQLLHCLDPPPHTLA